VKKIPARVRREFFRKILESKVFSSWILTIWAEFPAHSLQSREFATALGIRPLP